MVGFFFFGIILVAYLVIGYMILKDLNDDLDNIN